MVQDLNNTNQISITGIVDSAVEYSHTYTIKSDYYKKEEIFYKFFIKVPRKSEVCDRLPVIVSDLVIAKDDISEGDTVAIKGQVRTYNAFVDGRNHLIIKIFAKEVTKDPVYEENTETEEVNPNLVTLSGFLCQKPMLRVTPKRKQIADVLLAVNRQHKKSDYIPLIIWGQTAMMVKDLEIGTYVQIEGRLQSRTYLKRLSADEAQEKVAYEVSVSTLEVLELPTPKEQEEIDGTTEEQCESVDKAAEETSEM